MGSRGFTLVELMVVVAIVAVIAALALPASAELIRSKNEHMDVQRAETALLAARNQARTTRRCVLVEITANLITTTPYDGCDGGVLSGIQPALALRPVPFPRSTLTPFAPTLNASGLIFNRFGGTVENATSTMTITGYSGLTTKFEVLPAIGQVVRK